MGFYVCVYEYMHFYGTEVEFIHQPPSVLFFLSDLFGDKSDNFPKKKNKKCF